MKTAIVSVGNGNHNMIDNIYTLSRSNNDIYDGVADYIFRVLNLEPVEYFNLTEAEFKEPFKEWEMDLYQRDFINFEVKNNFSEKIKQDIEDIVLFIRRKAIKRKIIKEVFKDKYIESSIDYNAKFIEKQIIKYYKER